MVPEDGSETSLGGTDMLVKQMLHIRKVLLRSHALDSKSETYWGEVLIQAAL